MAQLGDRVKDKITSSQGIVVIITEWLYGCVRCTVQPEEREKGRPVDQFVVDDPQLVVIEEGVVEPQAAVLANANLGDSVRDVISGCTGILVGQSIHLNGTVRYAVQPEGESEGAPMAPFGMDAYQAQVVEPRKIEPFTTAEQRGSEEARKYGGRPDVPGR